MKNIELKAYIDFALKFTEKEKELREIFKNWLPDKIIDCHTHISLMECIENLEDEVYYRPLFSFPDFDISASQSISNIFYPNKKVFMLRFGTPFKGINLQKLNNYLLKQTPIEDRIALCGIPNDIKYTVSMLSNTRISALKMYYFFFNPPAKTIYHFFPKPILEEAQSKNLPIILHLPKPLSQCLDQIDNLIKNFPRLPVVLAHLGIYTEPIKNLMEGYKLISKFKNVFLDTSMVFSAKSISAAINSLGTEKILYGSDEPLNLLRIKLYFHPDLGFRMVSKYPYHWLSKEDYSKFSYLAKNIVHAHWQTLSAIKKALDKMPSSMQINTKNHIFFENSKELFLF